MHVTKLSNVEVVNLDDLSVEELFRLHYEEESFVAQEALKLPPFSNERNQLLNEGYEFVKKVMDMRGIKEFGAAPKTFGSSGRNVKLLTKLVQKKIKENASTQTVLYEAGVGTCFAIKKVLENFETSRIQIKGCDINFTPTACELTKDFPNVDLKEGHVYDCIKELPDSSIDVFYADNVFEHFLPDEAPVIYEEIAKKLKPQASLFLVIPNKYTGPHDISRHFLPKGEKANGFHFMEMSFNEVTENLKKYNIHHMYCPFFIPRIGMFFLMKNKLILALKLKLEHILAKIPSGFIKKILFSFGGYSFNIMEKR